MRRILAVSELSNIEYAYLLAAVEIRLEPKKFSCYRCAASYKPEHKHRKRKPKGCYDYSTKVYRLENIIYKTCIGNYNIDIGYFIEAFSLYEKGMLPFKGTLGEQPNKMLEIFGIIEQRRSEKREAKEG